MEISLNDRMQASIPDRQPGCLLVETNGFPSLPRDKFGFIIRISNYNYKIKSFFPLQLALAHHEVLSMEVIAVP
jgi:hypothetical protein